MHLRQLLKRTSKAAGLSSTEWSDLLRAQWHVLRAHLRVRGVPEGELMAEWASRPEEPRTAPDPTCLARAREIGDAVRRVGELGLSRPKCLARSLAISGMLQSEGIEGAAIHIGVRHATEQLEAHAWVEFAGEVIGDTRAYVSRFAELATTRAAKAR